MTRSLMMSNEFTEQFEKYSQIAIKPVTAFAELNTQWLNTSAKTAESLNEFINAKKIEDVVSAQVNLATKTSTATVEYFQKAFEIVSQTTNEFGKQFMSTAKDASKAADKAGK